MVATEVEDELGGPALMALNAVGFLEMVGWWIDQCMGAERI